MRVRLGVHVETSAGGYPRAVTMAAHGWKIGRKEERKEGWNQERKGGKDEELFVCDACVTGHVGSLSAFLPSKGCDPTVPIHTNNQACTSRWPVAPLNDICESAWMSDFYMSLLAKGE